MLGGDKNEVSLGSVGIGAYGEDSNMEHEEEMEANASIDTQAIKKVLFNAKLERKGLTFEKDAHIETISWFFSLLPS